MAGLEIPTAERRPHKLFILAGSPRKTVILVAAKNLRNRRTGQTAELGLIAGHRQFAEKLLNKMRSGRWAGHCNHDSSPGLGSLKLPGKRGSIEQDDGKRLAQRAILQLF